MDSTEYFTPNREQIECLSIIIPLIKSSSGVSLKVNNDTIVVEEITQNVSNAMLSLVKSLDNYIFDLSSTSDRFILTIK